MSLDKYTGNYFLAFHNRPVFYFMKLFSARQKRYSRIYYVVKINDQQQLQVAPYVLKDTANKIFFGYGILTGKMNMVIMFSKGTMEII